MDRSGDMKFGRTLERAGLLLRRSLSVPAVQVAFLFLSFVCVAGHAPAALAGDDATRIQLAFDLPSTMPQSLGTVPAPNSPSGIGQYEPVSQTVLAAQRGSGAALAMPMLPAAQSQPGIVLWDEMKPPQNQNVAAPGGQIINQINIQVR